MANLHVDKHDSFGRTACILSEEKRSAGAYSQVEGVNQGQGRGEPWHIAHKYRC